MIETKNKSIHKKTENKTKGKIEHHNVVNKQQHKNDRGA